MSKLRKENKFLVDETVAQPKYTYDFDKVYFKNREWNLREASLDVNEAS